MIWNDTPKVIICSLFSFFFAHLTSVCRCCGSMLCASPAFIFCTFFPLRNTKAYSHRLNFFFSFDFLFLSLYWLKNGVACTEMIQRFSRISGRFPFRRKSNVNRNMKCMKTKDYIFLSVLTNIFNPKIFSKKIFNFKTIQKFVSFFIVFNLSLMPKCSAEKMAWNQSAKNR